MKLLLDTHVWIWSQEAPGNLGPKTRTALLNPNNRLYISTVSTLELARLASLHRIELNMQLQSWVSRALELLKAETVVLSHEISLESYRLPEPFHRDPADRMLVATARILGLKLLTADDAILKYPHASTMDARK
jgi:PIN domain nuclease of toxin-antitoxin system